MDDMQTTKHPLSPPSLEDLAKTLAPALAANVHSSSISFEPCPDLRSPPYHLAAAGLSGSERIADIGGQPNLFPAPKLDRRYSLIAATKAMEMSHERGQLLGAGAGPFHAVGVNCELAPNLSWEGGFEKLEDRTTFTRVLESGKTVCRRSPVAECALMANLYGSEGSPGPVLKITARARKGSQGSLMECIRLRLREVYGETRQISLGGVVVVKKGKVRCHVMPDFPPEDQLPWTSGKQVQDWLTSHEFEAPMVGLTVLHSADPEGLELRMEHTHCFSVEGGSGGGHHHYDVPPGDGVEEVEYEAYLNTAKTLYRIDKPEVILERG